ncbi:piggyBac transposable element-derived protein 3 [Anabrus simplex]|uniref:piggyBac transposable element-derived protein 3 n=1 Tax=Anabrus simplex TaxID=316456 RepID=UPI0035A399FD
MEKLVPRRKESLSLNKILSILEEEPDCRVASVAVLPPSSMDDIVTDEESGEEDDLSVNHFPGLQLRVDAEMMNHEQDDVVDEEVVNNISNCYITEENHSKLTMSSKTAYVCITHDLETETAKIAQSSIAARKC